jgi:hypothetical protein
MRQRMMIFTALALGYLVIAQPSPAQVYYGSPERHVEVTPFIGYTLNTTTLVAYGEIKTDDGVAYGGTIGVDVNPGQQVEFLYFHQTTQSHFNAQSIYYDSFDFDVAFNYFMIGFAYEPNYRAKTRAFFRVGGGACWASPSYQGLSDTWRVAMDLALGLKIYPTDKIGIRLQAGVLMPLVFTGGGLYVGTGGAGVGVSAGIPIAQFNFSAGLIVVI